MRKAVKRRRPSRDAPPCPEESRGGGTAETQPQSPAEKDPAAPKIFRKDTDAGPGRDAAKRRGRRCKARPHSRPYMAYLEIKRGEYRYCSGFLVAENFVLTAAHCQEGKITVILGAHNVTKQEKSQQRICVRRKIPHPQYNRDTLNNDIMLLELEKPAELNDHVKTIPLPEPGEGVEPGTACSVAGWGRTIAAANVLQEVDVEVLEDDNCLKYDYYDPATMLSARHPQNCGDTAKGDSGGPLVCDGKAQGIVSRVSIDGITPGTYMRVSAFIGWIRNQMGWPQPERSQGSLHSPALPRSCALDTPRHQACLLEGLNAPQPSLSFPALASCSPLPQLFFYSCHTEPISTEAGDLRSRYRAAPWLGNGWVVALPSVRAGLWEILPVTSTCISLLETPLALPSVGLPHPLAPWSIHHPYQTHPVPEAANPAGGELRDECADLLPIKHQF
ncbi:uncharacterized protein LOC142821352 [Pelodiscus sinensis]|uniref:uncharacterized protein LOC142821352 n=1 Tax=Pelodiscus sinensis TaxID=13735 RepID=UPI003F6D3845